MWLEAVRNHRRRLWRRVTKSSTRAARRWPRVIRRQGSRGLRAPLVVLGDALDRISATRTCPACGSRATVQPLAICRSFRGVLGVPRTVVAAGCKSCGVLFASPQPSARAVAEIYADDGEWATEHARRANVRKDGPIVDSLDRHIGLRRPAGAASVLDIGCGSGRWLNTLAAFGWQTFGIEPSTKIAFAKHRELTAIPREPAFNLVILHHVLEHVARPGDMLRDCALALEPGGWLFLSVPNLTGLPHYRDWYYCLNGKAHLTAYTYEALQCLFARAGLAWHCCLDDPQAVIERREGSSRTRVLARKPAAGQEIPTPPANPLDAAIAALGGAGVLTGPTP